MTIRSFFSPFGSCLLLLLGFNSCTVYYQTSSVDAQLKKSVQGANENCSRLLNQVNTLESTFHALNCNQQQAPFNAATPYLSALDESTKQLKTLQLAIQNGYAQFQVYTQGKEKIASNTTEWKQLKATKKQLKADFKSIEKLGKEMVKEGESFNEFVAQKIVPIVSKVVIADYLASFEIAKKTINDSKMQLNNQLQGFHQQLNTFKNQSNGNFTKQIETLNNDLNRIQALLPQFNTYIEQLDFAEQLFKKQSAGKTIVYTCSPEWELLSASERSIADIQQSIFRLQNEITKIQQEMQSTLNELSKQ